jgi:hypothetical protein
MGSPIAQVTQQPLNQNRNVQQTPDPFGQPQGKGGSITYPGQSGQPQMGQPNQYSNTVGPWDNASIGNQQIQTFQQPTAPQQNRSVDLRQILRSGKGKGA